MCIFILLLLELYSVPLVGFSFVPLSPSSSFLLLSDEHLVPARPSLLCLSPSNSSTHVLLLTQLACRLSSRSRPILAARRAGIPVHPRCWACVWSVSALCFRPCTSPAVLLPSTLYLLGTCPCLIRPPTFVPTSVFETFTANNFSFHLLLSSLLIHFQCSISSFLLLWVVLRSGKIQFPLLHLHCLSFLFLLLFVDSTNIVSPPFIYTSFLFDYSHFCLVDPLRLFRPHRPPLGQSVQKTATDL